MADLEITLPASIVIPTSIGIDISTVLVLPSSFPVISIVYPTEAATPSSTPSSTVSLMASSSPTSCPSAPSPSNTNPAPAPHHHLSTNTALLAGLFTIVGIVGVLLCVLYICRQRRRESSSRKELASGNYVDDEQGVVLDKDHAVQEGAFPTALDTGSIEESEIVSAGGGVLPMRLSHKNRVFPPRGATDPEEATTGYPHFAVSDHGQRAEAIEAASFPSPESPPSTDSSALLISTSPSPSALAAITTGMSSESGAAAASAGYERPAPDASSYFPPSFGALALPDPRYHALRRWSSVRAPDRIGESSFGPQRARSLRSLGEAPVGARGNHLGLQSTEPVSLISSFTGRSRSESELRVDNTSWGATDEAEYLAAFGTASGAGGITPSSISSALLGPSTRA